eukprot:6457529-Amphidinium_carterae.1
MARDVESLRSRNRNSCEPKWHQQEPHYMHNAGGVIVAHPWTLEFFLGVERIVLGCVLSVGGGGRVGGMAWVLVTMPAKAKPKAKTQGGGRAPVQAPPLLKRPSGRNGAAKDVETGELPEAAPGAPAVSGPGAALETALQEMGGEGAPIGGAPAGDMNVDAGAGLGEFATFGHASHQPEETKKADARSKPSVQQILA